PDPRLPDGWSAPSVADRGGRGPRPPRVLLPGSGHDVPEETGPFRPGPPGRGARLPSAEGSVLRDGELRTLSLRRRLVFRDASRRRWAKALAIGDGRILAVGTEGQVSRASDRGTRRLDLHGRIVVPGFIDAHTHMADSAGELGWTRLDGTRSMTEAIARLRKA